MKVSQLEMGCSHVAVLLTKEERVYINNKKEEKKKEEEKIIKPKKEKVLMKMKIIWRKIKIMINWKK